MALSDADIQATQSAAPAWAEAANNQRRRPDRIADRMALA